MSKKSIRKNYLMIQGWMSEDLNLKGNELLAYALIYGFCQDEESEFTGSIKYIMRWLNCSKPTVLKAVDNLVKKGLVIKKQEQKNNVTFNHFTVNFNVVNKYFTPSKETLPLVKKLNKGSKETLQWGSKETLPNNIYNNKDNNKDNNTQSNDVLVNTCYDFNDFWKDYNKKVDRKRCESIYAKIKEDDRQKIKNTIHLYVATHKEKQFRKNPQTYLNGRNWEDDLTDVKNTNQTDAQKRMNSTPVQKPKWTY